METPIVERAEWRIRSDDPQTPLGWMVGGDRWGRVPAYPLVVAGGAGTIVVRFLCESWLPRGVGGGVGTFVSMVPLALAIAALTPKRYEVPLPDPSPGAIHVGTVRLDLGERALGSDRGTVAFDEGWLLFEGRRTSFAIRGGDVGEVRRIGDERVLDLTSGHRLRVSGRDGFAADFDRWLAQPPVAGLSRLPPSDPHPQARVRKASILMTASAGALGVGIGIAATSSLRSSFVLGTTLACVLVALVGAGLARRVRLT